MPRGFHSGNKVKGKHGIIKSLYLRLKDAAGDYFNSKIAVSVLCQDKIHFMATL